MGFKFSMTTACMTATLCFASVAMAETPAAAPPRGEGVVSTMEATATVTKIDQKTREVTIKTPDGKVTSFIAGDEVRNLPQVKVGDVIKVSYAEAFVYEVKKGGTTVAPQSAVAGTSAELGARPAGAIARQTTATVLITAIDPKVPSVTFKGPGGDTRTIKVMRPEKLKGVNVGDTVQVTFTEALAIKVTEAPKQP